MKSDFDVRTDTALSHAQFKNLFQRLPSLGKHFENDKHNNLASDSLYLYLMKLRSGRSHDDLGRIFNITKGTVSKRMNKVRQAMEDDFIYQNVNFLRSREELSKHTTNFSQILFCDSDKSRPVLVLDGTYLYIQKSTNYEFQKLSYNGHKKRNFIRVMVCTTTDGTIVSVLGPFPAKINDAAVMKSIVEHSNSFENSVEGDVILLDRGFRDCVKFLESKGFDVRTPALVSKKKTEPNQKTQLSTKEANQTRFVTANRYGVETRNGHFKTIFKIFQKEFPNNALSHIMSDLRVCAALINVYFKTIESNKDMAVEIARKMVDRMEIPNRLSTIVKLNAFQKGLKNFKQFTDFDSLPKLTETDLILIGLGSYQIRQAASYCQMHIKANNNEFVVFACPEAEKAQFLTDFNSAVKELELLMVRIKSRFRSNKTHDAYVLIDKTCKRKSKVNEENTVLAYCCSCQSGLRTVGCCSHVMCLIWFTLHIKNRNDMHMPAEFLNNFFIEEFSSEEEEEEE